MTLIRKIVAAAGIAGALLIPFTVTTATPAAAYCQAEPVDNGGNGCSNSCEDNANTWRKVMNRLPDEVHIGDPWLCPQ